MQAAADDQESFGNVASDAMLIARAAQSQAVRATWERVRTREEERAVEAELNAVEDEIAAATPCTLRGYTVQLRIVLASRCRYRDLEQEDPGTRLLARVIEGLERMAGDEGP
jgi:hypothetical protein